jgi:hypothetical protein
MVFLSTLQSFADYLPVSLFILLLTICLFLLFILFPALYSVHFFFILLVFEERGAA